MGSKAFILLFSVLFLSFNNVFSQINLSFSTTESRCSSTGSLTVHATGGTPTYIYEIISGPQTRIPQNDSTFSNLPAGNYTIRVIDNGSTTLIEIDSTVIIGNYMSPSLSLSGIQETCIGNDGEIYLTASNGRLPYSYQITSPISVGPQINDTFANLTSGTYLVRVTDSCGNFTTQAYNLPLKSYANLKNLETFIDSLTCDSMYITPSFAAIGTDWEDSLDQYVVDYYNPTDTVARGRFPFSVALERNKRFTFYVYDSCGNMDSQSASSIKTAFRTVSSNCPDNSYDLNFITRYASSSKTVKDITTNISYQLIAGPVTTPIQYNNSLFDSIPAGNGYVVEICDTVCLDCFRDTFNINTNGVGNFFLSPWYACDTGRGRIELQTGGFSPKLTMIVNNAPPTFPHPLPYTVSQLASASLNIFDCPKGFYSVIVTDSCSFTDTINTNLTQYDLQFNRNVSYTLACNNTYSITTAGSYRNREVSSSSSIYLLDSNFNIVDSLPNSFPATSLSGTNNFSYSFTNVNGSGKYYIRYQYFYSCPNQFIVDSVTLPPTNSPLNIDSLSALICSDSVYGNIEVFASGGLKPYDFEIIAGPVIVGPQLDSVFNNLPQGLYTIRVSDSCGQSSVFGTELTKYGASNLTPYGGVCFGDSLYVLADTLPGATYQWTGPNAYVSNSRLLSLEPLATTNIGVYSLRVQYGLCVDTTILYTVYGDTTKPTALCIDDTLYLTSGGIVNLNPNQINNGSYDSCGLVSMSVFPNSFNCNNLGVNNVIFVVADSNGNSDTCYSNITVLDTIAPTMICQNVTVYIDTIGIDTISFVDVNNGSFDNCGFSSIYLSDSIFNCSELGVNNVWLIGVDNSGNSDSCSAVINVLDTLPPVVNCQNITVYLDNTGAVTVLSSQVDNGSFDNCGIASMNLFPNSFSCSNVGVNNVTLSATDGSGNIDSCIAIVTVLDTLPPNILSNDTIVYLDSVGFASVNYSQIDAGSFDNCTIDTIYIYPDTFNCGNVGLNTVNIVVVDVFGNSDTAQANVDVRDTISPWLDSCLGNYTDTLDGSCSFVVPNFINGLNYYDNCDTSFVVLAQNPSAGTVIQVNSNGQLENYPVTISVTDGQLNVSYCFFDIELFCYPELIIPEFISPNGDNKNDTWIITGLSAFSDYDIKVFNRYGNLVFQSNNYLNDWDGSLNKNAVVFSKGDGILPAGTYFYLIDVEINDVVKNYKGYLFIRP